MKQNQLINLSHSEGYEVFKDITLTLNKSSRAKNISLRPKPANNEIVLTYPSFPFAKQQALKFIKTKENWLWQIFKKHNSMPSNDFSNIKFGEKIKFFGEEYTILNTSICHCEKQSDVAIHSTKNKRITSHINSEEKVIYISGDEQFLPRRLKSLQKQELEKYIKERTVFYFDRLKTISKSKSFGKITIRDTSSRWGSCASNGNLSFALKLCHYEKWIIDYVIAHELCHLVEMNHSTAFWNLVEQVYDNSIRLAKSKLKGVL